MKAQLFASLIIGLMVSGIQICRAQDFRVETDVYGDDSSESLSETLTLFAGDVVYDFFVKGPEEITVFDISRGRIVLLDATREVRTTVTTEQLLEFSAAIQAMAAEQKRLDEFDPEFTVRYDEATGELELASRPITYRAKGIEPKEATAVQRYRQFADWYARLNALKPGNGPPFGRLALNRALAERQLVPERVERVLVVQKPLGSKRFKAESRHLFVWKLSGTDRKRIDKASQYMATFKPVSAETYWQVDRLADRRKK